MKVLHETADRIVARVARYDGDIDDGMIRDHCDIVTGNELDTVELNILTDMVELRIKRYRKARQVEEERNNG